MSNQLALHNWAEFNKRKWNCQVERIKVQPEGSEAYAEMLFFLNQKGKLYLPPLNPYHPTVFHSTPTNKEYRITNQWHEVAELMITELRRVGGAASFCLPPQITDIRPFVWEGFITDIRYTYYIQLPYSMDGVSKAIRNRIRRARSSGYYCNKTTNMHDVHQCLAGTEQRKGFNHNLTVEDLEMGRALLGDDVFRCYVCYSKEGEPVSTNIAIVLNDTHAIGWIGSSKSEHLSQGVVQLLQHFELENLASIGLQGFDFCGANIPSVSEAKASWGGNLIPYYTVRTPVFKDVLRTVRNWIQFNKRK